jgi:pimeloyl-ACP methyl ester carboxylesterase
MLLLALAACGSPPRAEAPPPPTRSSGVLADFQGPVESFDGVPLHVVARAGPSPTLVFVHGWMCKGSYWDAQVEAFGADHGTVVLDLGGHGASGAERDVWDLDVMAADVQAVLDHFDLHEVILVGHSMGGPVSLKVAAARPERVVGIVGVDTLHDAEFRWPAEALEPFLAQLEADWNGTMKRFIDQMFVDNTSSVAMLVAADMDDTNARVGLALMRSYAALVMTEDFQNCPVPVRCINASAPNSTRVDSNRTYLADYDAVVVGGAGHFLQIEDAGTCNALMADALEDLRRDT